MNDALTGLQDNGVSVWLDDLSRELIDGGDLENLVRDKGVVGVTTNPTIFATALAKGDAYTDQVRELVAAGADVEKAVLAITTEDVRRACDLLAPVFEATGHLDGKVSLEVDPRMAHDEAATIASARQLWGEVSRPNLMIKIPATLAGLPAIRDAISEGISVNVTLIFGLERYRAVMEAYVEGIERAHQAGRDLAEISSVASFFVSRVDTEYDKRLDALGTDEAKALRGKAAIANARLAYQAYEEVFSTPRWRNLQDAGAKPQRPLWASTGVKNPDYSDTMYVDGLVAPGTVNTMPLATLNAVLDHGRITGDTVRGGYADAQETMDRLAGLGIAYDDVIETLEREGVDKFEKSWGELLGTVEDELERARAAASEEGGK